MVTSPYQTKNLYRVTAPELLYLWVVTGVRAPVGLSRFICIVLSQSEQLHRCGLVIQYYLYYYCWRSVCNITALVKLFLARSQYNNTSLLSYAGKRFQKRRPLSVIAVNNARLTVRSGVERKKMQTWSSADFSVNRPRRDIRERWSGLACPPISWTTRRRTHNWYPSGWKRSGRRSEKT